ncbi:hypothetical protein BD560DRAFT_418495, partial [Blakeslea trispora]
KGKSSLKVVCSVFAYSINSLTLAFLERYEFPRRRARDTSFFVRFRNIELFFVLGVTSNSLHLGNGIFKNRPEYWLVSSRLLQRMIQSKFNTNTLGGFKRIFDSFLLNDVRVNTGFLPLRGLPVALPLALLAPDRPKADSRNLIRSKRSSMRPSG